MHVSHLSHILGSVSMQLTGARLPSALRRISLTVMSEGFLESLVTTHMTTIGNKQTASVKERDNLFKIFLGDILACGNIF